MSLLHLLLLCKVTLTDSGIVQKPIRETSSHITCEEMLFYSQLTEPLPTDPWPNKWNWCAWADFHCIKKKKKKCRLTMIHYTFPCNLHRIRKRATTLILSSCPSVYTPSRTLCSSSDEKTLSCAKWKLKGFGHRSFSVQAPLVWNNLSPHIWQSCLFSQFKTSLKTFLFTNAFELPWFPRRFEIQLLMLVCGWFVGESESD